MTEMINVAVAQASGQVLDWLAGVAIHGEAQPASRGWKFGEGWLIPGEDDYGSLDVWNPSEDGDLLVELMTDYGIGIVEVDDQQGRWGATRHVSLLDRNQDGELCTIIYDEWLVCGDTPLVAALRALAVDKLGKRAEVPAILVEMQ